MVAATAAAIALKISRDQPTQTQLLPMKLMEVAVWILNSLLHAASYHHP